MSGLKYTGVHYGRELRKVRQEYRLRLKDVAAVIGVHEATVSGWETDTRPMPLHIYQKMREALAELIGYDACIPSDESSQLKIELPGISGRPAEPAPKPEPKPAPVRPAGKAEGGEVFRRMVKDLADELGLSNIEICNAMMDVCGMRRRDKRP